MKKIFTLVALLAFTYGISRATVHDTIVKWTFPTGTAIDTIADGGIGINLNKTIKIIGTGPITFSSGITTKAASAAGWKAGVDTKYWQVMFSTAGHDSLFFTSNQMSSPSGPRDFKIQYKIGKLGTWTNIHNDTFRLANAWQTPVFKDTLPSACNGKDSVFLRWDIRDTMSVGGTAISINGTSRIDNIKVWGRNASGIVNPAVTKATMNSLTSATVIFSTSVNTTTGQNIANYTGLGVTAATVSVTQDTVNLTMAGLHNGDAHTLTVAHIHDNSATAGDTMYVAQSFPFLYNGSVDTLVITEINYKMAANTSTTNDSLQYIELFNNSSTPTRVGGYKLNSGSGYSSTTFYTFPAGTIIAPNVYTVLAANATAINNFYNITNTIQWTGSHIPSTTSKLTLVNTLGGYIDSVRYKDVAPWDTTAHGHGPSLVLCTPSTSIAYNSNPANWLVAIENKGTIGGVIVYGNPGSGCTTEGISTYSDNTPALNCYPNPTHNNLTIAPNAFANDIVMFDILGNVVFEKKNVSSAININTSSLTNGMYFIRVTYSDNKVESRKISVN
jgi:hypothetical protein